MGIDPGGKAYVAENMQKKMMDILGPLGYYEGSYNQAKIDIVNIGSPEELAELSEEEVRNKERPGVGGLHHLWIYGLYWQARSYVVSPSNITIL